MIVQHRGIAVATGCGVLTLVRATSQRINMQLPLTRDLSSGCASISLGLGPLIFGASKDLFARCDDVTVFEHVSDERGWKGDSAFTYFDRAATPLFSH